MGHRAREERGLKAERDIPTEHNPTPAKLSRLKIAQDLPSSDILCRISTE